ncbi:phosphoribosyltransferase [Kamptonema formosum]|uniref:phosphoribosyltransferase n=1 Tax=Kamptonema formosum TaxID=331992 RepID=UPI00034C4FC9|nr:phosphoribosyltransferase [Oscillatoria sp. PCC 10802]
MRYRDRTEAGRLLAEQLQAYASRPEVLVLALPRGGVPVAFEVARRLNAPLDICLVRKLGAPGYKELAMGAIAPGGVMVLNQNVVGELRISKENIERVAAEEQQELERRNRTYRGDRPAPDIQNRTVILVDDGIATGSTVRAAIATLRQQKPERVVVAVPVAPLSTCNELKAEADEIVCLRALEPFRAISLWYGDFSQTTDDEVRSLLAKQSFVTSN